jgi:hypothetical protein
MIKHVAFNPQATFSLASMCEDLEALGYELQRVVAWQSFEAIAVFEKKDVPACAPEHAPLNETATDGPKPHDPGTTA